MFNHVLCSLHGHHLTGRCGVSNGHAVHESPDSSSQLENTMGERSGGGLLHCCEWAKVAMQSPASKHAAESMLSVADCTTSPGGKGRMEHFSFLGFAQKLLSSLVTTLSSAG